MHYKTILVYFESEQQVDHLLGTVAPLARAHDAHVIGAAVLPSYFKVPATDVGTAALIDDIRQNFRETTGAAMQAAFDKALRFETFQSEWRLIDPGFDDGLHAIAEAGSAADLVVACQDMRGAHDEGYRDGLGMLAVLTARPLLLVPDRDVPLSPPQKIVVAWDGSQQAARAVFDSLALLQGAAKVTVMTIHSPDEPAGFETAVRKQQGVDVCSALSRHGVNATGAIEPLRDGDVARTLLAGATSHKADLLVLGGYGHSRLQEWVFGGVTRSVLRHMKIPVLLSH